MIDVSINAVPSERFGAEGWVRTHQLRLLDCEVVLHTDSEALARAVNGLFVNTVSDVDVAAAHELFVGRALGPEGSGYFLALDGVVLLRSVAPTVVFRHLIFHMNQLAIEHTSGVRLHAGAAASGDSTVVIPGAMGAGKSTLVAGLIRRGLDYVTDEVVAFDAGGRIRRYLKPLSLGRPPAVLGDVAWVPPSGAERFVGAFGVVPPEVLGPVSATAALTPALVVLPTYERGVATTVEELAGSDFLAAIAAHTFQLELPGAFADLARVLGEIPGIRVRSGDLTSACDVVLDRLAAATQ